MRKYYSMLIALLVAGGLMAQDLAIDFGTKSSTAVVENSMESVKVNYSFNGVSTFKVKTEKGDFNEIAIPGTYSIGNLGTPKLPAAKDLIEIPFGAEVSVEVLNYNVQRYTLGDYGIENAVMPMQPSLAKDTYPSDVKFEYEASAYARKSFEGTELATVEVLGTLRGMRLARLVISPVKYNPATNEIEVYNNVEVRVNFTNADEAQTAYVKAATYSPYFTPVYNSIINNRSAIDDYPDHPDLTTYPIKMLIVADRMFEATLAEFIDWKTKCGFEVITAYTDVIGTSFIDVQTYVHDQYAAGTPDDPAPSFVILVGDIQQVPMSMGSSSSKYTDLYYGSVDGDYFPEMYYSRMSAQTVPQLESIMAKTLYYERYEFEDPSYLDRVTLIAGADDPWNFRVGQATIEYGTESYFNTAHGYTQVNDYLSSYDGCYETIDAGVGFINYTAHCGETSWSNPNLSINDVNAFINENMYTLTVANCCNSHDINTNECIGETWMRKENGGSIIYIGSAPSSYWFEDFYWGVGAFPIQGFNDGYVPTVEETTMGVYDAMFDLESYNCADATIFIGNLAVTEVDIQGYPQHSSPLYYWQAYMCGGDASLLPYHTQGTENTVSHMTFVPIEVDFYEVTADPGSYVGISKDGVLHGAAFVPAAGVVEVPIEPIVSDGNVDIVVTGPQKIPYVAVVPADALEEPYIVMDYFEINDATGNNNQIADFGEDISLHITLKNVGADPAVSVNSSVSGTDTYVTLGTTGSVDFGTIAIDASVTVSNAFDFAIANDTPNGHQASFVVTSTDGTDSWTSNLRINVYSPVLAAGSIITIDDSQTGNGNGIVDAGETIKVFINTTNNGGCAAVSTVGTLSTTASEINITTDTDNIGTIAANATEVAEFTIDVNSGVAMGTVVSVDFEAVSGDFTSTVSYAIEIGQIIEDFETGDLTAYDWNTDGDANWIIQSDVVYEGDNAAASGTIPDNGKSNLFIECNVLADDVISFYCKVSSENSYDYLKFYIDDVMQGEWAGEVDWSIVEFPVTAGEHTFKWAYEKDVSNAIGDDKAWVDNINFPPMELPIMPLSMNISSSASAICLGGETQLFAYTSGGSGDYSFLWTPSNAVDDAIASNPMVTATSATEFTCTVTDNGTSETVYNQISLDVIDIPTVEITLTGTTLTATEGSSYQWYDGAGPIDEAADQGFTVTSTETYYCIIANSAGCLSDASNSIWVGFDSINGELVDNDLNVHPNPAADAVYVDYSILDNSQVSIRIYNTLGKLVKNVENGSKVAGKHIQQISISDMNTGIYYVVLESATVKLTQKLVVK